MLDLSTFPAIDQHAHNLLKPEVLSSLPYTAAFTESGDPQIWRQHAPTSLNYRRSLREVADLLACDPQAEAIRAAQAQLGWEAWTRRCLTAANLEAVFLDDGFLSEAILPLDWHRQFVPVHRILRLEVLAQQILPQAQNFEEFLARFRSELDPPPSGVVAFKSIAAYRTGLEVQAVSREMAAFSFAALWPKTQGSPLRLADKPLIDFLLVQALEIAAKHEIPVQFHTGFGDPDLDLRLANPLYLRPLLEDRRYRRAPIVLLHAAYPYSREAGYLASVYPQVYLDFGLAVPLLSVAGMRQTVQMLLELTPTSKLLYSSDAHLIPDLYYLGAKWGRQALAQALEQAIQDGDLTAQEAEEIALAILHQNARRLHRLP